MCVCASVCVWWGSCNLLSRVRLKWNHPPRTPTTTTTSTSTSPTSPRAATGRLALSLSYHLRLRSKTSSWMEECRLEVLVPLGVPGESFFIVDVLVWRRLNPNQIKKKKKKFNKTNKQTTLILRGLVTVFFLLGLYLLSVYINFFLLPFCYLENEK